jgi:hypothetical protein
LFAAVTPLMRSLSEKYPDLKIYSLPSAGEDGKPKHVELGLKAYADQSAGGDVSETAQPPQALLQAYEEFRQGVLALQGIIVEERQASR